MCFPIGRHSLIVNSEKKTTTKKFIFLNKEELGKISMTLINDPQLLTWEYDICFPNIMITNLID